MVAFLGPSYGVANKDTSYGLFGPQVAYDYPLINRNVANDMPLNTLAAQSKWALVFHPDVSGTVPYIDVYFKAVGSPGSGTLTAQILNSAQAVLATSAVQSILPISNSNFTRIRFTFASPATVTAAALFYVVIAGSYSTNGSNYVIIAAGAHNGTDAVFPINGSGVFGSVINESAVLDVYVNVKASIGFSFLSSGDQKVDHIDLDLAKLGTPPGNLSVTIYDDDGAGKPLTTGPANNTSLSVVASSLSTTMGMISFAFSTPPQLLDGRRYHAILTAAGALTAVNDVLIGIDTLTPTYTNGSMDQSRPSNQWYVYSDYDVVFAVYFVAQTLPTTLADSLAEIGTPPSECNNQSPWLTALLNKLSTYFPSILPPQYGGTGIGKYRAGQILIATDDRHLEVINPGIVGSILGIAADGLPSWLAAGAQRILVPYVDNTVAGMFEGDVVMRDITIDDGVIFASVLGEELFAGVVAGFANPGGIVQVVTHGITKVRLSGSAVRGNSLVPSSVSRRAQVIASRNAVMIALQNGSDGDLIDAFVNVGAKRDTAAEEYYEAGISATPSSGGTIRSVNITLATQARIRIWFSVNVSVASSGNNLDIRANIDSGVYQNTFYNDTSGSTASRTINSEDVTVPMPAGIHNILITAPHGGTFSTGKLHIMPLR